MAARAAPGVTAAMNNTTRAAYEKMIYAVAAATEAFAYFSCQALRPWDIPVARHQRTQQRHIRRQRIIDTWQQRE